MQMSEDLQKRGVCKLTIRFNDLFFLTMARKKVLIAEDHVDIRMMKTLVRRYGYVVIEPGTAAKRLKKPNSIDRILFLLI